MKCHVSFPELHLAPPETLSFTLGWEMTTFKTLMFLLNQKLQILPSHAAFQVSHAGQPVCINDADCHRCHWRGAAQESISPTAKKNGASYFSMFSSVFSRFPHSKKWSPAASCCCCSETLFKTHPQFLVLC